MSATARMSSMRPLVQEPTKTTSTGISRIGVPGFRSMYSRARSAARRSSSPEMSSGSGTVSPSGTPWPGLVPQVTKGVSAEPSISTTVSNSASTSVTSESQHATAASHSLPCGAWGRPLRYS